MKKELKNIAASIKDKLSNIAKDSKVNYDYVLQLYVQERFLYRLSCSKYKTNFILKGGLLLYVQNKLKGRTTKDIDFLGIKIPNDLIILKKAFEEVIIMEYPDGIIFRKDSVKLERIKENADYEGIHITVDANIDKSRIKLQLDIGFGDVVVKGPIEIDFPTLLDMDTPVIDAYSLESVIAEKFEAMLTLSLYNSRMKDFYDIYSLMKSRSFKSSVLYEAIGETLKRRKTNIQETPDIFQEKFYSDPEKINQWNAFSKKLNMPSVDLKVICLNLKEFINPVYQSILATKAFKADWDYKTIAWIRKAGEN